MTKSILFRPEGSRRKKNGAPHSRWAGECRWLPRCARRLATRGLAAAILLAAPASQAAQGAGDWVAAFHRELDTALALPKPRGAALRKLLPFLSPREAAALAAAEPGELRSVLRGLGTIGQGRLVFLHLEKVAGGEGQAVLQALCELRRLRGKLVAARRVPVREAARAFRIAKHHSALRLEAETGATEMLEEIEIEVTHPTQWIFFFLDPGRQVLSVSIEMGAAEVFRVANFVALERGAAWARGERVRLEVRSRLLPKKEA